MTRTEITANRVAIAFAVAIAADALQLPLNLLALTGSLAIPSVVADLFIDGAACIAVSLLLGGFHWVLAPTFLIEAVPLFDSVPTWTAAVAILVAIRKRQAARVNDRVEPNDASTSSPAPRPFISRFGVTRSGNESAS